jgi:hypothetical protein
MGKLLNIFCLATFLFPLFSFANPPELHDTDKRSYYSQVMHSGAGLYADELTSDCKKRLRTLFSQGKTLEIPEIRDSAVLIKDYKFYSGRSDSVFYHYTDSIGLQALVKLENIDQMFWYFRSGFGKKGTNMYLAEDPTSSNNFGKTQIRVTLNSQARVFNGNALDSHQLIQNKFPDLETCWTQDLKMKNGVTNPAYFDLILEENKIDLQNYWSDNSWVQLIRKSAIQKISIGKSDEW